MFGKKEKRDAKRAVEARDVQTLLQLLSDPDDPEVRANTANQCMNLPPEAADPTLVSALLRAAVEPEAQVRGQAILALGSMRAPEGADIFLRALSEDDWSILMFAATAIGWMPDQRAIGGLGRLLQHEEPLVRGSAAFALGAIGSDESAAVLRVSREEERDPDVREAIDEALGKLGHQGGVP
jgi:HEAT repeat protein